MTTRGTLFYHPEKSGRQDQQPIERSEHDKSRGSYYKLGFTTSIQGDRANFFDNKPNS